MKKKHSLSIFMLIYVLAGMGANFAHPITPNYLKYLDFPSSMFGLVFAAMSLTNFLFSPFWGVMSRYVSAKKLLFIGSIGYGVGQFLFGFFSSPWIIIMGRLISGAFISAVFVAASYYVISISSDEDKSKNIAKMVTVFSVSGMAGYFLGGYLGTINLFLPFVVQVSVLVLSGVLFYVLLLDNEVESDVDLNRIWSGSNPLVKRKTPLSRDFKILFVVILLTSIASTTLSQTYSYYLVDVLNMTSFANGVTKGLVGIGSMILNFTLTLWIVKSRDVSRKISYVHLSIALVGITLIVFGKEALLFSGIGIVMMILDSVSVSLLQSKNTQIATTDNQGEMLGLHNAYKNLGGIVGSLVAGVIYEWYVLLPFIGLIVLYLLASQFVKRVT